MALSKITAASITDNTITNTQINSSAAIAKTKLAALDITNSDVNASAAIAASKVASDYALIHTIDASNQAAVTFTSSHITSTYQDYVVKIRYSTPATNGQRLYLAPSIDNGSNYNLLVEQTMQFHDMKTVSSEGPVTNGVGNSSSIFQLNAGIESTTTKGAGLEISLIGLTQTTGGKRLFWNAIGVHDLDAGHNDGADYWWNGAGKIIQSSAINNLKFYYASGNVAQGKFSLYGIRA